MKYITWILLQTFAEFTLNVAGLIVLVIFWVFMIACAIGAVCRLWEWIMGIMEADAKKLS